jgi:kynurenine formamidase
VGRGVLADVERYLSASRGRGLDHEHAEGFGPELLDAVLSEQGVTCRSGDILLIRTGWPAFFDEKTREGVTGLKLSAGLEQSHEMLGWLWDHQVAVVAADNFALEALPPARTSPFLNDDGKGHTDRLLHPNLIALLGMVVGELWSLDGLAADCAADRVYEFMTVIHPLNITGAAGSPANAVAIK